MSERRIDVSEITSFTFTGVYSMVINQHIFYVQQHQNSRAALHYQKRNRNSTQSSKQNKAKKQ